MRATRITKHSSTWFTIHAGGEYVAGAATLAAVKDKARLRGVSVARDLKPTPPPGRPPKVGGDRYT